MTDRANRLWVTALLSWGAMVIATAVLVYANATITGRTGDIDIKTAEEAAFTVAFVLALPLAVVSALVLLDINMPSMSGWEFLEMFDNLDYDVKERVRICILSSSIDDRDRERSYSNKNVADFLVKPLTDKDILRITSPELKKTKPA